MIRWPHLVVALSLLFGVAATRADYPIMSHRALADPAPLVHDGRVYVYCSNDDDSPLAGGYEMKSLVCVSSADLKNWTDHGEVIRVPRDAGWANHTWAPAVIERGGKFFLYFSNNASGIGVATSDRPTGPFVDPLGKALINAQTPGVLPAQNMWIFDPAVFIDHDGQAYLYFGGNGESNLRIIRLGEDMISVQGAALPVTVPHFFEAAWMHERDGRYYLSYSTTPAAGLRIDYLLADSPTGPFTAAGVVAGQPPSNNNNNHAAIFSFRGQWYHLYHNRFVALERGLPAVYRRNLGLEVLHYEADGRIREVQYTRDGVLPVFNLSPYERVEAETFHSQSGLVTEPAAEGGMNVTGLQEGDWIRVRGVDFGAGARTVAARVASEGPGGRLWWRVDGPTGRIIASHTVDSTGGPQRWQTVEAEVEAVTGVHDLYLTFSGTGASLFNLDWWRFTPAAPLSVTLQPRPLTVAPGQRAQFWVQVNLPESAVTFQWWRDGERITGATSSMLTLAAAQSSDAGDYRVVVAFSEGEVTSATATLTVRAGAPAELNNLSVRARLEEGDVVIPGFVLQPVADGAGGSRAKNADVVDPH